MFDTRMSRRNLLAIAVVAAAIAMPSQVQAAEIEWRYGHMNAPSTVTGQQAEWFAEAVAKYTDGQIEVQVFPSSQLGKLQELAEMVSTGSIALSHNTAGAYGSLYAPFAALDTPYLYRDVDHLMKVVDVDSPVMQKLNQGLIENAGVRVLYAFYFGTRNLTANKEVKAPVDLSGVKIRAIPFPIYMTAVQGLGAAPVPVDWSEVPTALATGQVAGQENPVNVVLNNKLYDVQDYMMLTGHISAAEIVVVNEDVWQGLRDDQRAAIRKAADEVRERATQAVLDQEKSDLDTLREAGMTIIGPEQGLDVAAFRASVGKLVQEKLAPDYGEIYEMIAAVK